MILPAAVASTFQAGLIAATLVWFLVANLNWFRLVRQQDPTIYVDPISDPVQWFRSASARLEGSLRHARVPATNPETELWRVRMLRRGLVAIVASFSLSLAAPTLLSAFSVLVGPDRIGDDLWSALVGILRGRLHPGVLPIPHRSRPASIRKRGPDPMGRSRRRPIRSRFVRSCRLVHRFQSNSKIVGSEPGRLMRDRHNLCP